MPPLNTGRFPGARSADGAPRQSQQRLLPPSLQPLDLQPVCGALELGGTLSAAAATSLNTSFNLQPVRASAEANGGSATTIWAAIAAIHPAAIPFLAICHSTRVADGDAKAASATVKPTLLEQEFHLQPVYRAQELLMAWQLQHQQRLLPPSLPPFNLQPACQAFEQKLWQHCNGTVMATAATSSNATTQLVARPPERVSQ